MKKRIAAEYISCLHLWENKNFCDPNDWGRIARILRLCPSSLFKYRKFDKWTYDIIENKYAYLTPVRDLDDPFDCVGVFGKRFEKIKTKEVKLRFIKYVAKHIGISIDEKEIAIVDGCSKTFDTEIEDNTRIIYSKLYRMGITGEEADKKAILFYNCLSTFDAYARDDVFSSFSHILTYSDEHIGVCSLSETNDNKVMWSLYGKKYDGYCIQYEISNEPSLRRFLLPVIYTRKPNNNFFEKWFDTIIAETKRHTFQNDSITTTIENVGAIYELFCTKDIDWEYQKEWRLIGNHGSHFTDIDIKAIYLGFKVAKTNEQKMTRYAKRYKFDLFKMKAPDGKKKIRFVKLV